jgi:serine/threonine-protein kinase
MATVYLAHDVKHDRKVALKVLRPELAAVIGAERFLQEIKVTANLQHSHILPLYDSGAAEGFLFYVMPYVEGENLRIKLEREKQLSVEEAVELTRAVAAALEHAHKQGVVHRDIKPENILLRDGDPLIADFGIALAVSHAGGNRLTETGLSIGTPHYMSPEQAMGDRELDARSDVYSLGAVLYEMLTGEPPHQGSTAQAIVARVITEEPRSITLQRRTVPPHVADAVHKALNKLPADRFSSAASFAEALVTPGYVTPAATRAEAAAGEPRRRDWRQLALAGALVVAIGVAVTGWLRSAPEPSVTRFMVALPAGQGVSNRFGTTMAISPDGSRFVYVGPGEAGVQLWLRSMNDLNATPLPGTTGASSPFFSPDAQSVAFFLTSPSLQLRVVSLAGGPPLTLADSATPLGGSWGRDGYLYVSKVGQQDGLARVPQAGGPFEELAWPDSAGGREYWWPEALPNGRGVLVASAGTSANDTDIGVLDLETREVKLILRGLTARYASPGFIVYTRADGALLAAPFDQDRLELTGPSIPLIEGVVTKASAASEFTISGTGTLIYLSGEPGAEQLTWVERDGAERPVDASLQHDFGSLALSPDGSRIVLSYQGEAEQDLWLYDIGQATLSRLTFQGDLNERAAWLPDGRQFTFMSNASGQRALHTMSADGSGPPTLTIGTHRPLQEADWSRDGRWLVFRSGPGGEATARDIHYLERGDTTPRTFLATEFDELNPKISPDGRWLAYVANESGRDEVYVRPFPGPGGRWQVSTDGGTEPLWANNGRELFYRSTAGMLVRAEVRTGTTFSVGARTPLFSVSQFDSDRTHTFYDISPDDRRFLMVKQLGGAREVVVVLNWFQEVEERLRGSR